MPSDHTHRYSVWPQNGQGFSLLIVITPLGHHRGLADHVVLAVLDAQIGVALHISKCGPVTIGANCGIPVKTYARLATWIEPEVVDGVLVVRQAYHSAVVDGVLEVE